MKVSSERLEGSQVLLQIEVEPERSAKSVDEAYRRLVGRVSVPGFRKGRAPRHIVERMVGREALLQEGIDLLLPEVYREAVAETGIEPIDRPQVDIVQEQPLVLKVTVSVRPEVELGDYHDIHLEREQLSVLEDEIDTWLQRLREQHAEWIPVERPVAVGDLANLDVVGSIRGLPVLYDPRGEAILETETGERIIDQQGVDYRVSPEDATPVQGFAEQLVGVKAGDEKRFELTFPPDYPNDRVANKAVIFKAKVNGVKEQKLPELDDEFAKTVGDYETLDALRQSIKKDIQRHKEQEAEDSLRKRVLNVVADGAKIELPGSLVDKETDRMVERVERRFKRADAEMATYLRSIQRDADQLRGEYRADAIASLRRHFVLDEVAKRENIEVSPDEVDAALNGLIEVLGKQSARTEELLRSPERREEMAEDVRHRKALDRLVAIATGEAEKTANEPLSATALPDSEAASEIESKADMPGPE